MTEQIAEWLDRIAISELKARSFRAVDTHDWALLRSVFTDDAAFVGRGLITEGADEIVKRVRDFLDGGFSSHHGHMPELTIAGDSATGIWTMEDYVGLPSGEIYRGYGLYHDVYVRTNGGWLVARTELTRLRFEWLPSEDPATWNYS